MQVRVHHEDQSMVRDGLNGTMQAPTIMMMPGTIAIRLYIIIYRKQVRVRDDALYIYLLSTNTTRSLLIISDLSKIQ